MRTHRVLLAATLAATSFACGSGAAPDQGAGNAAGESGGYANPPAGGATTPGESTSARVVMITPVPAGVQCIVATLTGNTSETVSTSVTAGAASATINFGVLEFGPLTAIAYAYNSACPATGTPTWASDPVQATVIAGVATTIPIVLHPMSSGAGSVVFSQAAISVAAGSTTSYAVLQDGTVRAWGANDRGQFGAGVAGPSSYTPVVVPGVTNAVSITAGDAFACVIRTDHSVMCWGVTDGNRLQSFYTTSTTSMSVPFLQPGLFVLAESASMMRGMTFMGMDGTLGMTDGPLIWGAAPATIPIDLVGGSIVCLNDPCTISQEGITSCTSSTPIAVGPAAHVYQGNESTLATNGCALLVNGTVSCWGTANNSGELGLGSVSTTAVSPTIVPGLSNVGTMTLSRNINAPAAFACAAIQNGPVLCSGANSQGQLGNGTITSSTTFTPVTGLTNVIQLSAGENDTCALRNDGSIYCWGNNDSGQLGDGTTTTRFMPVPVSPW